MANTYSAGIVTAYGAAKRGGYTGTYEEFCEEQANFGRWAQQVREDKESVEQTVETFTETTVPNAVQSVEDKGAEQIGLVGNAGTTQIQNVNEAGSTQLGNVQNEGTTQVNRVQDKGDEVIDSIPPDYSDLTAEVDDLNRQISDVESALSVTKSINNDYVNCGLKNNINPSMFEIGNIGTGMEYLNSLTRIRTTEGVLIHLIPGSVIGLKDYTNAQFYLRWIRINGTNTNNSFMSSDFTVEEEGYYAIIVANNPETTITNVNDLASLVFIRQNYSIEKLSEGKYELSGSNFMQGVYNATTHKVSTGETRRIISVLNITKGQVVVGESDTQYMFYYLYDDTDTLVQQSANFEHKIAFECVTEGLLILIIANGETYASSTNIVPADYDCNLTLYSPGNGELRQELISYELKERDFLQGVYDTSLVLLPGEKKRISAKVPVKKGDVIYVEKCNHFIFFRLIANGVIIDDIRPQRAPYKYICLDDGMLCVSICTAYNYNDCVDIVPSDLNGEILYIPEQIAKFVNDTIRDYKSLQNHNMITVDHRGFTTKAPENTIPAFALAKANGYDWVETDIQLTGDNPPIPVLLHDSTIDRTSNGTGNISDMTLQQARQYDFSKGYDNYTDIKIPTLEEFLIYCKYIGLKAVLELKTDHVWTISEIEMVVGLVNKYMLNDNIIYSSFSHDALQYVIQTDETANVAYVQNTVTAEYIGYANDFFTGKNAVYFSSDFNSIKSNEALFAGTGLKVMGWTVEQNNVVNTTTISPIIDYILSTDIQISDILIRDVMSYYTYQV
jgi:glycerophosphoryl diester phosphodiesterase